MTATTYALAVAVIAAAPIVADAIERARQRAGLSHKELALSMGLREAQWSQQLHGYPGSHVWLDTLTATPPTFRAALLEELRATWQLDAPTIADVYALVLTMVRPRMARAGLVASTRPRAEEDSCAS